MSLTKSDDEPTPKASLACAKWLQQCLSFGWPKSSLDDLENLWWQYHDRQGNLITSKEDSRES